MSAFYNENDPFPAAWLRNLCERGLIAPGLVDERSIAELQPEDVPDGQAHFFAGIGGWSYALRLAGVADGAPVWTGSCPCQPFSAAGKRLGHADERHLWPEWFRLIRQRRPAIVFGEQVAGPAGLAWLEAVCADLEGCGYAFGSAVLPAAGVGAPHGRHRIFFGAYAERDAAEPWRATVEHGEGDGAPCSGTHAELGRRGDIRGWRGPGWLDPVTARQASDAGATRGYWGDCDWWWGRDGKWRPAGPGVQPLAHGVLARMGRLRGYGNAIVPQVAAEFVTAFLESVQDVLL